MCNPSCLIHHVYLMFVVLCVFCVIHVSCLILYVCLLFCVSCVIPHMYSVMSYLLCVFCLVYFNFMSVVTPDEFFGCSLAALAN